ncbi:hypothetical protein IQ06DRAFT_336306 [Phaeosphaeriaceae sp. SRC1lsM3a]|nr:hypothetical protein IQ06DRAFT_336306 [Stagonospora sp. SRC1lsM3a]
MPSFSKTLIAILLASSTTLALPTPQLAGEGSALNSIVSDFDNASGYGVEDALDNIANNISQLKGQTGTAGNTGTGGSGNPPPPPPPPKERRQLDKWAAGIQAVSDAAGTGSSTSSLTDQLKSLDGTLTSGAAQAGEQIGETEVNVAEGIGKSVPK